VRVGISAQVGAKIELIFSANQYDLVLQWAPLVAQRWVTARTANQYINRNMAPEEAPELVMRQEGDPKDLERAYKGELSQRLMQEYQEAGVHDVRDMVRLYKPFGRQKITIMPNMVTALSGLGVSMERMEELRRVSDDLGSGYYWRDNAYGRGPNAQLIVDRAQGIIDRVEAHEKVVGDKRRVRGLEAEHERLLPQLTAAHEAASPEEKERIEELESAFIHGLYLNPAVVNTEFIAWAQTIVPGAFGGRTGKREVESTAGLIFDTLAAMARSVADDGGLYWTDYELMPDGRMQKVVIRPEDREAWLEDIPGLSAEDRETILETLSEKAGLDALAKGFVVAEAAETFDVLPDEGSIVLYRAPMNNVPRIV